MHASRSALACAIVVAAVVVGSIATGAGQQGQPQQGAGRLQLEPLGNKYEAVFPYFEGWYRNDDGTSTILLGYYNRNTDQVFDIPIGPNNRIEPGGPDRGQPTHFLPRRQWGIFTITVPKDFGTQKITWTLTANNLTNSVSVWLNPQYFVEPFRNLANGNVPPTIKFAEAGPAMQGPPRAMGPPLTASVNQPLPLAIWATDLPSTYDAATNTFLSLDQVAANQAKAAAGRGAAGRGADAGRGAGRGADAAAGADAGRGAAGRGAEPPPIAIINGQVIGATARGGGGGGGGAGRGGGPPADVTILWTKYRGPGTVTFAQDRIPVQLKGDFKSFQKAETTVTFNEPGDYMLRVVANDSSGDGGGGDQCCWTTSHVRVTVK